MLVLQVPCHAQESGSSQAAWHTEMAEFLAVRMQTILSQFPQAGLLAWSAPGPCPLLGKGSHPELPEPAPEAPLYSLPD